MLYKFKSQASGDLIMLEPHGRRVLQIIGKDVDAPSGILLPDQMPAAIIALQSAIAVDEAFREAVTEQAAARDETAAELDVVTLRQRATPFIEMMRRCHEAERPIVWGL